MKHIPLGTLADIKTGKLDVNAQDIDGVYPFFTCAATPYKINQYAFDNEAVLVAGNGDLNVKYYDGKFNAYQRTYVIQNKDNKRLCMKYLYYFMNTYIEQLRRDAIGGIIKYIKLGNLTNAQIPLPPIKEQEKISHLLDRVDRIIVQRKESISKLDTLLKSAFINTFGDPIKNSHGWNKLPFNDLLESIDSGKSPKCLTREANEGEWGVLKLGAITPCVYGQSENKALPLDIAPSTKHEVKAGDLLFSRKNTYELVGACAYVFSTRPQLLLPDLIFRFVFKENVNVNPIYMWQLLINDTQRRSIQKLASGAAGSMPNISKANLKKVLLPIPPLALQDKFSEIVKKVEAIKSDYKNNLECLESLFKSLKQKAFKGELDLSGVDLDKIHYRPAKRDNTDDLSKSALDKIISSTRTLSPIGDTNLNDETSRKEKISDWFNEWIQNLPRKSNLNINHFWQCMDYATQDYLDENDNPFEVKLTDYDHIKSEIFNAIKNGSIEQTTNLIEVVDEATDQKIVEPGNEILLRKLD